MNQGEGGARGARGAKWYRRKRIGGSAGDDIGKRFTIDGEER